MPSKQAMRGLSLLVTLFQLSHCDAWLSSRRTYAGKRHSVLFVASPPYRQSQATRSSSPGQQQQQQQQQNYFRNTQHFQDQLPRSPSHHPHALRLEGVPNQESYQQHRQEQDHYEYYPVENAPPAQTTNGNNGEILASSPSTFLNKASATARKNFSRTAKFSQNELDHPFGRGTFRFVAMGEYVAGPRAGHPCVGKFFQDGSIYEESYFENDMKVTQRAIQLVALWNQEEIILDMIHVNHPEVWTFHKNSNEDWRDTKLLIEPYIKNFQKFNSNSGWNDSTFDWGKAMQALSHFSYHISGGQLLLCDLQGGVTPQGLILTDPAIMSTEIGAYGPTDLGPDGIDMFFRHHQCNEFCRAHWMTPECSFNNNNMLVGQRGSNQVYRRRRGTTMVRVDKDGDNTQQNRHSQQQWQQPRPPSTRPPVLAAQKSSRQQIAPPSYYSNKKAWYE